MVQRPQTRTALVVQGPGEVKEVAALPIPDLSSTEVLVKTVCVSLNPSDAKMVNAGVPLGAVAGLDFAGIVLDKGVEVRSTIKAGDRVCGIALGYNENRPATGAFAEYIVVEADLLLAIPEHLSFEEASTLPCGLLTAGLVLYKNMKLPRHTDSGSYVLVYGGSTATGTLMIQLLNKSGLAPIAVCSAHNFNLVKKAGAVATFDYHSTSCAADIRAYTSDDLEYAVDCITDTNSISICYGALGNRGGRYVALDKFPVSGHTRRAVRPSWVFAMTAFGCAVNWVGSYSSGPVPEDREFAASWFREVETMVREGTVHAHPCKVVGHGLGSIAGGLEPLQKGQVSGFKLACFVNKPVYVN